MLKLILILSAGLGTTAQAGTYYQMGNWTFGENGEYCVTVGNVTECDSEDEDAKKSDIRNVTAMHAGNQAKKKNEEKK